MIELVQSVLERREHLRRGVARGYARALERLPLRAGPEIEGALPPGMLDALAIAGVLRGTAIDRHYLETMPAQLAVQLRGRDCPEERLFAHRLDLQRLPRLREGLDRLFAFVSDAGVQCAPALGAATPRDLIAARPTVGHLYAGCHFGRSMPMLYAYAGDLAGEAWSGRGPDELIDARYVGPLIHELSHLHPSDADLVPAPANLHEALAAWIGSEAWPDQVFPAAGAEDALPGAPWFAAVGAFVARRIGAEETVRAQAGALDLAGPLGAACVGAMRCYGWLDFLETGAPHLLGDAFHPARWWKLIDLHRDPPLSRRFHAELVAPLLERVPRPGEQLRAAWNGVLDALPWPELPAWRDAPSAADDALAARAVRALHVRTERRGRSFRAVRAPPPGPLELDGLQCSLRAPWGSRDAIGAPPEHPYPPPLCANHVRDGRAPGFPPPR